MEGHKTPKELHEALTIISNRSQPHTKFLVTPSLALPSPSCLLLVSGKAKAMEYASRDGGRGAQGVGWGGGRESPPLL